LTQLDPATALDALGVRCNRCGRCCRSHGGDLPASAGDLERWRNAGDAGAALLEWVMPASASVPRAGELWRDPGTGARWDAAWCPWGREHSDGRHTCTIYPLRPDACRTFPELAGQVDTICAVAGLELIGR